MNMRKWLISAVILTLALATAGAVTAFALTGDGGSDNPQVPNGGDTAGEVLDGDPTYPVTSIDDIDPNVCNLIHNRKPCTPEELEEVFGEDTLHGDPTYEDWLANYKPTQGPVTSIDDIDPNVAVAQVASG